MAFGRGFRGQAIYLSEPTLACTTNVQYRNRGRVAYYRLRGGGLLSSSLEGELGGTLVRIQSITRGSG